MKVIRIACQDSPLAVAKAHMVIQAVRDCDPLVVPELITLRPSAAGPEGESGVYSCLSAALEDGSADICVHSLGAMPARENPALPTAAVSYREEARDVMVLPQCRERPDLSRPLGCFGVRRKMQLAGLFPGWRVEPAPEDITASLDKLDNGEYGALITAADEMFHLQLQERIYQVFSVRQIMPGWGQGIVAVQGRAGEKARYLAKFHSVDSWDMVLAERAFADVMGEVLMAAHATVSGDKITITGMMVDKNGKIWEGVLGGDREDAAGIGAALAARIRLDAAGPILRGKKRYDD